ncbi:hypothetical protein MKX01_003715 [Papaver californicum]|nr:hypothetical protein MKX01_003715 [Papaver californicum]
MAFNIGSVSLHPNLLSHSVTFVSKHNHLFLFNKLSSSSSNSLVANHFYSSSSFTVAVHSEGAQGVTDEEGPPGSNGSHSSSRTQLDLLDQLSSSTEGYASDGESRQLTIREQLTQLVGDREGEDFSIPLGKNLKKVSATFLTISQKRNIKRKAYLDDVSRRNDTFFFSIAAFVIIPPIIILGVAVSTGYVQLLP